MATGILIGLLVVQDVLLVGWLFYWVLSAKNRGW